MKKRKARKVLTSFLKIKKFSAQKIIAAIVLAAAAITLVNLCIAVRNSDYFKIKDVIIEGNQGLDLSNLRGENIFAVDLDQESRSLEQIYSNYKSIRFIRVVPDRVYVDFIERVPVAIVKLYKCFCVDYEGVFFSCPDQCKKQELPVIKGLETRIFGPKTDKSYRQVRELEVALEIISELSINKVTRGCRVDSIDMKNPESIRFFINAQRPIPFFSREGSSLKEVTRIEVMIGQEELRRKISILGGLLKRNKTKTEQIKYIDLRFNEPVMKFKDA